MYQDSRSQQENQYYDENIKFSGYQNQYTQAQPISKTRRLQSVRREQDQNYVENLFQNMFQQGGWGQAFGMAGTVAMGFGMSLMADFFGEDDGQAEPAQPVGVYDDSDDELENEIENSDLNTGFDDAKFRSRNS